jgi:beta-lactam-binding protein with PASTA domain
MDNASDILGKPVRAFDDPSDKILEGDFVSVPDVSGMSVDDAKQVLKEAGLGGDVAGRTYSNLPEGTVVYADPSGRALRGTTVGLYTSLGYVPKPKETPKPKKTTKTPDKPKPSPTTPKPKPTTTRG